MSADILLHTTRRRQAADTSTFPSYHAFPEHGPHLQATPEDE